MWVPGILQIKCAMNLARVAALCLFYWIKFSPNWSGSLHNVVSRCAVPILLDQVSPKLVRLTPQCCALNVISLSLGQMTCIVCKLMQELITALQRS